MGIILNGNTPTHIMYNGTEATLYYNGVKIWPEGPVVRHVILRQYAGGTIPASPMTGYNGDSVTFEATPNKFYALSRLYYSYPNGAWGYKTTSPFTTSFGNADISAYASFQYTASTVTGMAYPIGEVTITEDYGPSHSGIATSAIHSGDIIVSASGYNAFVPSWGNSQLYWCNGDNNKNQGTLTYISGSSIGSSGVYSGTITGSNIRLWWSNDANNYSAMRYLVTG